MRGRQQRGVAPRRQLAQTSPPVVDHPLLGLVPRTATMPSEAREQTSILDWLLRCMQASNKTISLTEWEKKLADVKVRKEDMNKLVMNFFVTEV